MRALEFVISREEPTPAANDTVSESLINYLFYCDYANDNNDKITNHVHTVQINWPLYLYATKNQILNILADGNPVSIFLKQSMLNLDLK